MYPTLAADGSYVVGVSNAYHSYYLMALDGNQHSEVYESMEDGGWLEDSGKRIDLFVCKRDRRVYFLNASGEVIVTAPDGVNAQGSVYYSFSEGLCPVESVDGLYGVIDATGSLVIP